MEVLNNSIKNLRVVAEKQGVNEETSITCAVAKIKVFGVGGAGGNVLKRLSESELKDIELIAVNTDAHALSLLNVENIKEIPNEKNRFPYLFIFNDIWENRFKILRKSKRFPMKAMMILL